MKRTIDVKSREEGNSVARGLGDPVTRAIVVVMGTLQQLPSAKQRLSVMNYIAERMNDHIEALPDRDSGPAQMRLHDGTEG